MNVSFCGGDVCWLCSTLGSCCSCEISGSPWSKSASQGSFCTFDGHEGPAHSDVDEPAFCTIDGDYLFAGAFDCPEFEIDDMTQRPGRGSPQLHAASTPKNNDGAEKWESPDVMPPPESSSPVYFDADSSPPTWMSCKEGPAGNRRLSRGQTDDGRWRVKAQFNHLASSSAPVVPTTTLMSCYHPLPTDIPMPAHGSPDERLRAVGTRQVATDTYDVCAATSQIHIEGASDAEKRAGVDCVPAPDNLLPASRKKTALSGPPILELAISTRLEPTSSHATDNDQTYDVIPTSSKTKRDDGVLSDMLCRRASLVSIPCPEQATMDNSRKRRRSSVSCLPESKRVKLDRTLSHLSCSSNSSVQSKYQATEPASLRRAQSLKSEISACSEGSIDSLFYPSPLTPLTSRPFPDKDYPPTVPSTPLPNSVDYSRSKANPLARTLAVYRRSSLDTPAIPSVPIIAPPSHLPPTVVRCAEDHAIDRLEALLFRERLERERDGLNVHDGKRAERLIAIYGTDLSNSRRECDTESTSDSSDGWEEESTRSATESQESQEFSQSVKIQVLSEQHRLVNREIWINAYGISNDFRKEVTRWILKKVPEKPEPLPDNAPRDEHPRGVDLYDQLMNSYQTRFHAAQLFHRYFLLPEKVQYWREACKYELLIQESWHDLDFERGVWDLAVACVGLSVKLHRDCLWPLRPVFATEFLKMAPYPTTHETFELAQRDVLYSFQFQLGSCTPQDVLDELWNALPTLRKATAPLGWPVVQRETWDRLFGSLFEPDMLQYPVTLLTAAALVDSLALALVCQYGSEEAAKDCKCNALAKTRVSEGVLDDIEPVTWQIHLFEANQLVDDVILDVRAVLHLSPMELDECRKWLSHVCKA